MKEQAEDTAIDELKKSIFTLNEALNEKEQAVFNLEKSLQTKNESLFNLEESINEKDHLIESRNQEIEILKEQLRLLRHNQFAKKSESVNSLQMEIAFEPQEESEADESEDEKEIITYERKSKR